MGKGDDTRSTILEHALDRVSRVGLEALTIGDLAKLVGMSKSGLYAHFESKQDLQVHVLETAADRFVDVVLSPALKEPRGLPRVHALFERWMTWATDEFPGGCPFMAAATELDDRPGPARDRLADYLRDVLGAVGQAARIAIEEGHFRADLDVDQFAYELWATLVAYHHFARFMRDPAAADRARGAFQRLVDSAGT